MITPSQTPSVCPPSLGPFSLPPPRSAPKHCRIDTNDQRMKRKWCGVGKCIQHWRRIQFCSDAEMADKWSKSPEHAAYTNQTGLKISKSLFMQNKCFCIASTEFDECSCPVCTQMGQYVKVCPCSPMMPLLPQHMPPPHNASQLHTLSHTTTHQAHGCMRRVAV